MSADIESMIDSQWTASLNVTNLVDTRYCSNVDTLDHGSSHGSLALPC